MLILDFIASYMLNDQTEAWVNVDWATLDRSVDWTPGGSPGTGPGTATSPFAAGADRGDPQWWGIAGGLACDIDEKLGLAGRVEYFKDDGGTRLGILDPGGILTEKRTDYWALTGTLSYHLTERLMARAEFRYDWLDTDSNDQQPFPEHDVGTSETNAVGIVEVSYSFD